MEEQLIKYVEGMQGGQRIKDWLVTHVFTQDHYEQQEVEHVIDFLMSDKAPKNLNKASYKQMQKKTDDWVKALNKKGASIKELKKDTKIVLDFKDGFRVVQLVGKNAYKREGFLMRHCVADYYGKDDEVYSLRDKNNTPHATMSKSSQQIKGKGNGSIHPKYIKYVIEFLEYLDVEVRKGEMKGLGYVDIQDIEDDNIDWGNSLFRGRYFYKQDLDKIKDKKNNKYESITLWQTFGLISGVKFNFNFSFSLFAFINKVTKKAGQDWNTQAGQNSNTQAGQDWNTQAGQDRNTQAGRDWNTQAGRDWNTQAGRDWNIHLMDGENNVAVSRKGAIMRGNKGSLMVFVRVDKHDNVLGAITKIIDGKKIKEGVFYTLAAPDSEDVIEAKLNDEQKERVRKAEESMKLVENLQEFYN